MTAYQRPSRRQAALMTLAATLAALRPARAGDELRIVIPADSSEIIATDLKRLRLAEPAEFVFVKTDPAAFERRFSGDDAPALSYLRFLVQAAARRSFGDMTSAEVLRGDGTPAFVARVNADCEIIHVALHSHTLRYEPVPPLGAGK